MENLRFTRDHEWAAQQDGVIYVGITDYAQHSMGDIVFVELPKIGAQMKAGKLFATIESVKAVSDIYAPVSGAVLKTNNALLDAPELLNEDPYEQWLVAVDPADEMELDSLMDADDYEVFCSQEG